MRGIDEPGLNARIGPVAVARDADLTVGRIEKRARRAFHPAHAVGKEVALREKKRCEHGEECEEKPAAAEGSAEGFKADADGAAERSTGASHAGISGVWPHSGQRVGVARRS